MGRGVWLRADGYLRMAGIGARVRGDHDGDAPVRVDSAPVPVIPR